MDLDPSQDKAKGYNLILHGRDETTAVSDQNPEIDLFQKVGTIFRSGNKVGHIQRQCWSLQSQNSSFQSGRNDAQPINNSRWNDSRCWQKSYSSRRRNHIADFNYSYLSDLVKYTFVLCDRLDNEFLVGMDIQIQIQATIDLRYKRIQTRYGEVQFFNKPISNGINKRVKIRCKKKLRGNG